MIESVLGALIFLLGCVQKKETSTKSSATLGGRNPKLQVEVRDEIFAKFEGSNEYNGYILSACDSDICLNFYKKPGIYRLPKLSDGTHRIALQGCKLNEASFELNTENCFRIDSQEVLPPKAAAPISRSQLELLRGLGHNSRLAEITLRSMREYNFLAGSCPRGGPQTASFNAFLKDPAKLYQYAACLDIYEETILPAGLGLAADEFGLDPKEEYSVEVTEFGPIVSVGVMTGGPAGLIAKNMSLGEMGSLGADAIDSMADFKEVVTAATQGLPQADALKVREGLERRRLAMFQAAADLNSLGITLADSAGAEGVEKVSRTLDTLASSNISHVAQSLAQISESPITNAIGTAAAHIGISTSATATYRLAKETSGYLTTGVRQNQGRNIRVNLANAALAAAGGVAAIPLGATIDGSMAVGGHMNTTLYEIKDKNGKTVHSYSYPPSQQFPGNASAEDLTKIFEGQPGWKKVKRSGKISGSTLKNSLKKHLDANESRGIAHIALATRQAIVIKNLAKDWSNETLAGAGKEADRLKSRLSEGITELAQNDETIQLLRGKMLSEESKNQILDLQLKREVINLVNETGFKFANPSLLDLMDAGWTGRPDSYLEGKDLKELNNKADALLVNFLQDPRVAQTPGAQGTELKQVQNYVKSKFSGSGLDFSKDRAALKELSENCGSLRALRTSMEDSVLRSKDIVKKAIVGIESELGTNPELISKIEEIKDPRKVFNLAVTAEKELTEGKAPITRSATDKDAYKFSATIAGLSLRLGPVEIAMANPYGYLAPSAPKRTPLPALDPVKTAIANSQPPEAPKKLPITAPVTQDKNQDKEGVQIKAVRMDSPSSDSDSKETARKAKIRRQKSKLKLTDALLEDIPSDCNELNDWEFIVNQSMAEIEFERSFQRLALQGAVN